MWLFTSTGFVSVVAYDPAKDKTPNSSFKKIAKSKDSHLLVRARVKEDLNQLKSVVPNLVVETDEGADYSFRAVVSRKKYKEFIAKSVDTITYDSHFKEAADAASTGASGRHAAMMSVWSAMAKLQPTAPYSGWSSGASHWGGGKSSPTSGSTWSAKRKASAQGYEDMDDFWAHYTNADLSIPGSGPRKGFVEGEKVSTSVGPGVVKSVSPAKPGSLSDVDLVQVILTEGNRVATFASNFLFPADAFFEDEAEVEGEAVLELEDMKVWLFDHDVDTYPDTDLNLLDDEAFELLTRAQEKFTAGRLSEADVERIADEIQWETASEVDKVAWAKSDREVPERYVSEAVARNLENA